MKIANDIIYIGVDDREIDLFEGQYVVPEGISYNSYVVKDDKIAVFDSADKAKVDEWMSNLAAALDGAKPDFFVISHMEPDHSAGIEAFAKAYPDATFVGNSKTFDMCAKFFKTELKNKLVVKEGDTLSLGAHELAFYTAPMVHWPEVMVTFDKTAGVLFSADAFGKFGALDAEDDDWACEARRYYFNIVGKYGAQVLQFLPGRAGGGGHLVGGRLPFSTQVGQVLGGGDGPGPHRRQSRRHGGGYFVGRLLDGRQLLVGRLGTGPQGFIYLSGDFYGQFHDLAFCQFQAPPLPCRSDRPAAGPGSSPHRYAVGEIGQHTLF